MIRAGALLLTSKAHGRREGAGGSGGGGGGGAAAASVSKWGSMSSQKSRSGTPSAPLSGQRKTSTGATAGNGVVLPRKPTRSVYVFKIPLYFVPRRFFLSRWARNRHPELLVECSGRMKSPIFQNNYIDCLITSCKTLDLYLASGFKTISSYPSTTWTYWLAFRICYRSWDFLITTVAYEILRLRSWRTSLFILMEIDKEKLGYVHYCLTRDLLELCHIG